MAARRLVLVRHAKAEQSGSDPARRLTGRGRNDARAIGRWLTENEVVPQMAVVSPAQRALQTWELAASELANPIPRVVNERVYDNTVDDLLDVVRAVDDGVQTLAVIGHNPSIQSLASLLSDDDRNAALVDALTEKFPTASVAVIDVEGEWGQAGRAPASLSAFGVCRG